MKGPFVPALASLAVTIGLVILTASTAGDSAVAADLAVKTSAPLHAAGQFWVESDYLAWTVKGDKLPPLVTTSSPGTPQAQAGVLGAPGTSILFGDSSVNDGWRSGGSVQAGYWFDARRTTGIEGSFFGLEQSSDAFNASSNGSPILARPFFDIFNNQQTAFLVAFPGAFAGSISASETSHLPERAGCTAATSGRGARSVSVRRSAIAICIRLIA